MEHDSAMIFKSIFKEGNHKVFDTLIKFEYVFLKLVFMVIKILKPGGVGGGGGGGDGRCWGVEGYLSIILWIELDVADLCIHAFFSDVFPSFLLLHVYPAYASFVLGIDLFSKLIWSNLLLPTKNDS